MADKKTRSAGRQAGAAAEKSKAQTVSVVFLESVRGTYGAFDRGDRAELPLALAESFIRERKAERAAD